MILRLAVLQNQTLILEPGLGKDYHSLKNPNSK